MKKTSALIVGDTSGFHLGSRLNCAGLTSLISQRHWLVAWVGGKEFRFKSYGAFLKYISRSPIPNLIADSEVIYCNGEGLLEPRSLYGRAFFYLAKYVRTQWSEKRIALINFSCFDKQYGPWHYFDVLAPRDAISFELLKSAHPNVKLGFDCGLIKTPRQICCRSHKTITIVRGKRLPPRNTRQVLAQHFPDKQVRFRSTFWRFHSHNIGNRDTITTWWRIIQQSHLVVSSSFHGIVWSAIAGVPFIPLPTTPTSKNEAIAKDLLGRLYGQRNFLEWAEWYKNPEHYRQVCERLAKMRPSWRKRAGVYISLW